MQQRFLLIDGLNLIRRLYAALESEQDSKRRVERTQNLTIDAVVKLKEQCAPTHLVIVFDSPSATWRHNLYPEYKLGRTPMDDALMVGLEQIVAGLRFNGWKCLRLAGWEADDLIATLAVKAAANQVTCFVVSTDKGFTQLIRHPHIHIYDYFNKRGYDREWVENRYGVKVEQLPDYWALVGDSTNHVKGVTGIGPKSAQQLLALAPDLQTLFNHPALPDAMQRKLSGQFDACMLARKLVTLRDDVNIGVSLAQLRLRQ
ncbi:flap endonuclease Xni [Maribrevibacterium harenarium]|uniref:Flap endonuclease Xni n=1 Tax=Maribrevibacterium harenarium TaxID=2589817 RepID=A0A501WDW4_9GAMM|nr:flap endonuclease Xni [Maribrevibacterium harenarium]TPE47588.1 flap endonuclease Xni [Maribrevibacterium harenarium]